MRKVIASMSMTLDGYCDHTAGIADEQTHQHFTDMLYQGGVILFGRITYELMEFWPPLVKNPSGEKAMDNFAVAIDKIQKVVFAKTLKKLQWGSARLATKGLEEEVLQLRQQPGKDILVGSRSIIVQLLHLGLVDELQLCVQPIILGKGLSLLDEVTNRVDLQLIDTKLFSKSGIMMLSYKPVKK